MADGARQPHDVIIILGCPSDEDGWASTCQTARVQIATRLRDSGYGNAFIASKDPGHLMMSALCDSNCCVDLGRLTAFTLPLADNTGTENVGHYVLFPQAETIAPAECATIQGLLKLMCLNLGTRKACKANFQLPSPWDATW
ncbi:MAG: hypothetical protein ACI9MR_000526 [Myxococcota bacterium]